MATHPPTGQSARPDGHDEVLALAERAVGLQPAAEVVIQWRRLGAEAMREHAEEGRRVERGYRALVDELASLRSPPLVGAHLGALLARHLELVRQALRGPRAPDGLGTAAGELVALRDLLRRGIPLRGRRVTDLPGL
jgi:hypothetical protein